MRRLREAAGRDIAACIISGDMDARLGQEALEAGLPLLRKPVRPAKLRSILRHHVQLTKLEAIGLNQLPQALAPFSLKGGQATEHCLSQS